MEKEIDVFLFEAESYVGKHLMKTVMFNMFIEKRNVKGIFQSLRRDEQSAYLPGSRTLSIPRRGLAGGRTKNR